MTYRFRLIVRQHANTTLSVMDFTLCAQDSGAHVGGVTVEPRLSRGDQMRDPSLSEFVAYSPI